MIEFNNVVFEDLKLIDGLHSYSNEIDRIFKRYETGKGDYENSKKAIEIFDQLGWEKEQHKDILTPFWRLFTAALAFYSQGHEYKRGCWNDNSVEPTYILDNENCLRYRTYYDKKDDTNGTPLGKGKIGKLYHEKNETYYENIVKTVAFFPQMKLLAKLSDSIANFAPCPETPFNILKGLMPDVCDFLNLMVVKIQKHKDCQQDLNFVDVSGHKWMASYKQIEGWHKWLIDNQQKFFLEEYYSVINDRLIGIPVFEGQTLEKPLPETKETIESAISRIINIIIRRGEKMKKKLFI